MVQQREHLLSTNVTWVQLWPGGICFGLIAGSCFAKRVFLWVFRIFFFHKKTMLPNSSLTRLRDLHEN